MASVRDSLDARIRASVWGVEYGFRIQFGTESVPDFVRIPYKILYEFRTDFGTNSVPNLVRNPYQEFGFGSKYGHERRPDFCTDSVHDFGTDSVHKFDFSEKTLPKWISG